MRRVVVKISLTGLLTAAILGLIFFGLEPEPRLPFAAFSEDSAIEVPPANFSPADRGIMGFIDDELPFSLIEKIEPPFGGSTLSYGVISGFSEGLDSYSILQVLGGRANAKVTLSEVYLTLRGQRHGEIGPLLLDYDRGNLFYVEDAGGYLRAMFVRWKDNGWWLSQESVGPYTSYRRYGVGTRIFVRAKPFFLD